MSDPKIRIRSSMASATWSYPPRKVLAVTDDDVFTQDSVPRAFADALLSDGRAEVVDDTQDGTDSDTAADLAQARQRIAELEAELAKARAASAARPAPRRPARARGEG